MNRFVPGGCMLVALACACSVGDPQEGPLQPVAPKTRLVTWRTVTETLRVAGAQEPVLEEVPVERFSVGNGAMETPPVARPDGVPATQETDVPEPAATGPVRVAWNATDGDESDDSSPQARPQRIDAPSRGPTGDGGASHPRPIGGNPCCTSPCGVSAVSLHALAANPAMTAGAVDPLTTVAGRSAMLAANRVGAGLGPASSRVGAAANRGVFGGGRSVVTNRPH